MYLKTEPAISPSNRTLRASCKCRRIVNRFTRSSASVERRTLRSSPHIARSCCTLLYTVEKYPIERIMKVAGYFFCAFGLLSVMSIANAAGLEDKIDQQFLDSLASEATVRTKRPFCNAFTGCGKKRSLYSENTVNNDEDVTDEIRIPVPIYRALLRTASREIREALDRQSSTENAIPDVGIAYPTYLAQKIRSLERYQS